MIARVLTPLAVAGVAAAALAFAPVAAADSNSKECTTRGAASICQKTGHASINASPEATQTGNTAAWPFGGSGQMPPPWAFD